MTIWPMCKGLLTFVPWIQGLSPRKHNAGSKSASYCYGVWLKHLTLLRQNGMRSIPNTLAELGPGSSLGVGMAAMLSGVNNYYALDVTRHENTQLNLKILDELIALFRSRARRPHKGWPPIDGYLNDNLFPDHILNDKLLERSLADERITAIRNAIANPTPKRNSVTIKYIAPWSDIDAIEQGTVDVLLSHSVLEHVVDLEHTYRALWAWLKPHGIMSHQIDFNSHGTSKAWNGYREYSELAWKMVMGKRTFLINRQPYSMHRDLMTSNGFELICELKSHRADGINRSQLSDYWRDITDDDLTCAAAFVQAHKKPVVSNPLIRHLRPEPAAEQRPLELLH